MPSRSPPAAELDFEIVHKIEQQGERQLSLALKNVDPLKEIDFYNFVSQLRRERFHFNWPNWIYNREEQPPTAAELEALNERSVYDGNALKELPTHPGRPTEGLPGLQHGHYGQYPHYHRGVDIPCDQTGVHSPNNGWGSQ